MKYLEAVIKESLRLYPSIPSVGRDVMTDIHATNRAGELVVIPKWTILGWHPYFVHRDDYHWSDPEAFDPDRFLDPPQDRHKFSFLAFSAGERNCIGQRYAINEMLAILTHLVKDFKWESKKKIVKHNFQFTLKAEKIPIKFIRRNKFNQEILKKS